ncbi:hypothetical protein [Globicatella sanguinis]
MKSRDIFNFMQLSFLQKYALYDNAIISGGCFKNIFNNEKIKDVDLFFRNEDDYNEAIERAELLKKQETYEFVYQNDKVKSYRDKENNLRLEFVKTIFGEPQQIIEQFDFTITKFAFYKDEEYVDEDNYLLQFRILHHDDFFEHLQTKRLVIDNALNFPISSFERSYRYRDKGYKLCRESKNKLLKCINELTEEQLKDVSKALYDGMD